MKKKIAKYKNKFVSLQQGQILFTALHIKFKSRPTVQRNAANSNKLFGHTFTKYNFVFNHVY